MATLCFCPAPPPGRNGASVASVASVASCHSRWLANAPARPPLARARAPHASRRSWIVAADKGLGLPAELDRLVDSFAAVPDAKLRYQQLLFFAKKLPAMDAALKTEKNLVRGCTSVVHVHVRLDEDSLVRIEGDSDGQLTKGLVALLVNGLSGCTLDEVLAVDPAFIAASGLSISLTPSRNNGFVNMVALIKAKLAALKDGAEASKAADGGEAGDIPGRPLYSSMVRKLRALKPVEVKVTDNSAQHAGHSAMTGTSKHGAGKEFAGERLSPESHFRVRVVSEVFEDMSLVKRHRFIYTLLADEMAAAHAMNIEAFTPAEVAARAAR
jgi:BolA-like protein 1